MKFSKNEQNKPLSASNIYRTNDLNIYLYIHVILNLFLGIYKNLDCIDVGNIKDRAKHILF